LGELPVVLVFLIAAGGLIFLLAIYRCFVEVKNFAAGKGACFLLIFNNQEEVAEEIVRRFFSSMASRYPKAEVVLMDDGSRDETGTILEKLAGHYGFRFIVLPEENQIRQILGCGRRGKRK